MLNEQKIKRVKSTLTLKFEDELEVSVLLDALETHRRALRNINATIVLNATEMVLSRVKNELNWKKEE